GPVGAWLYDTFGVTVAFTWQGAALASAVMAFPLMVRAIRLSIEAVDSRREQAARTLGARPLDVFFTVTLPLTGSGILAGVI
ncbi:molybdate ABC transporter permease subunit, partial [Enterococcus hirae]